MAYDVTLITGDGIGPEIAEATKKCLDATGVEFNWDIQTAGIDIMEEEGTPLPDRVLESIRKNKVAIKAPITTPVGKGFRSVNVALRKAFDLYACVRPCKSYEGVRTKFPETNLVVVRENTEDLYAGIEFKKGEPGTLELIDTIEKLEGTRIKADAGISIKPITVEGTRRVVQFAFDYARQNGRKKVTAVHKANIMKFSDGLYLEVAREVAKANSDIEFDDKIVDNMCMQLIQWPEYYDVLVLPNLYGDIVSDLCAGLVGGLGMAPGGNIGQDIALFEATHGSAPKYAGLNKVNPSALILSGVLMLHHLGEKAAADKLENAVAKVIKEGKNVTYDLKPTKTDPTAVGTQEMAQAIIEEMNK